METLQQLPHNHSPGPLNPEKARPSPDNMPLQAFVMGQLNMDISLDLDDSFSSMSCPSSANLSASSSVYDSYTPLSGRSTPQGGHPNSFDFGFCNSSTMQYDFTPPSTASTGYFPLEHKMENLEFQHSIQQQGQQQNRSNPVTPARKSVGLSTGSEMGMMELSVGSHPPLGMYSFNNDSSPIHTLSFGQPTLTPPHRSGSTPDASSMWNFSVDSPILFNKHPSSNGSPVKSVKLESPTSSSIHNLSSPARRKLCIGEAQQKASVLQHVQRISSQRRAMKNEHIQHEYSDYSEYIDGRIPATLSTIPRSGWKCQHPGCDKSFKRSEHLKRHFDGTHNPEKDQDVDRCVFCPKTFKNRPDNYRQHLRLHADPKREGESGYRVQYFPEAEAALHREEEKTRHKRHKTKAQSRSRQATTRSQARSSLPQLPKLDLSKFELPGY